MKRAFMSTLITACALFASLPAHADDWGCTVLLCLANPNGPQAVAECVEPINRLWDHLRRGRPFPTCQMSDGSNSASAGAYVRHRSTYYDPCPSGTTDLAMGLRASSVHQTHVRTGRFGGNDVIVSVYASGIGTGDGVSPGYATNTGASALPPKVCVGTRTGLAYGEELDAEGMRRVVPVEIYDRVVLLKPNTSPRVIDVYIDNALYQRVRW